MLTLEKRFKIAFRITATIILFIPCLTFPRLVNAENNLKEKTAEEYRALGYAAQQKGNLGDALGAYSKAIALGQEENAVLLNDMGVIYEEIDLSKRAEEFYLKAIECDKAYLPPYNNLAYLYKRLGQNDRAVNYFKMRFELGHPGDPWTEKAKDEILKIDPRYREWITSLEANTLNQHLEEKKHRDFIEKVGQSQEHFLKGESLFKEGEYDDALAEYDAALQLSPDNPKIVEARRTVLLEMAKKNVREQSDQALERLEMGDTLSARHEIQKMLTTMPEDPILISR